MANGLVTVGLSRSEFKEAESQLLGIMAHLKHAEVKVKVALANAVNKTARYIESQVAKDIVKEVAIKQRDIKRYIDIKTRANKGNPRAVVVLSKSKRIQLIYFGARQNKSGVSYKIAKKGPRKFIKSAFIMTRGKKRTTETVGDDFRMVTKRIGKARLPITGPLRGPSPWGVYVINGMQKKTVTDGTARLRKELKEQVRVAMLRAKGTIK